MPRKHARFDHERLDVLVARKRLDQAEEGKAMLARVVSMRVGLIRSTSPRRVYDDVTEYGNRRGESANHD
jgi:hypothetical protein